MKKKLLNSIFTSFCLVLLIFSAKAQVSIRISIANGSWSNPAIWSPVGVPNLADDSIVINTAVTYNQNIVDGQAMFRINAGASLIDLGIDTAAFGGDKLVVNGYFSCSFLGIGMNDSATVKGILYAADGIAQSGTFIVQPNGQVCVGQQLTTSDNFINNGSVGTNNWINSAMVTGNQGRFCIANYFINSDAISGNIDICDATPNTPMDVNAGTIAGSVTNCTAPACGLCPIPNGIKDHFLIANAIRIYPNPFSSTASIEINPALLNSNLNLSFVMFIVNGQEVKREKIISQKLTIEREDLSSGLYFYQLKIDSEAITSGKIIVE